MKLRFLVAVALALPGVARAQNQQGAPGETVTLRFAWPAGLSATMASERIRVRQAETADSSAAAATYHMQSGKGQGDERLVRFSDFELEVPAQTEARVQEMIEQIAQLVPSYRINNAGEFLGVVMEELENAGQGGGTLGFPLMRLKATLLGGSVHETESTEASVRVAKIRSIRP